MLLTGRQGKEYPLMEKYYKSSPDLNLQYAEQLLNDGDEKKAVNVAEEGVALFKDYASSGLREFLSQIYKETDPANSYSGPLPQTRFNFCFGYFASILIKFKYLITL